MQTARVCMIPAGLHDRAGGGGGSGDDALRSRGARAGRRRRAPLRRRRPARADAAPDRRPLLFLMAHIEPGKPAAMDVKMSSDMPLPTPFSVTSSPSHMMRPV